MRFQLNGFAICNAQPFSNGISTLDHTVQDVHRRIFSGNEAIDPALGAVIPGVGLVEFGHQIAC